MGTQISGFYGRHHFIIVSTGGGRRRRGVLRREAKKKGDGGALAPNALHRVLQNAWHQCCMIPISILSPSPPPTTFLPPFCFYERMTMICPENDRGWDAQESHHCSIGSGGAGHCQDGWRLPPAAAADQQVILYPTLATSHALAPPLGAGSRQSANRTTLWQNSQQPVEPVFGMSLQS